MAEVDGGERSERALRRLRWSFRARVIGRRAAAVVLWFVGLLLFEEAVHVGVWLGRGPWQNAYLDLATAWRHYGVIPAVGGAFGWLIAFVVVGQLARLVDYRWFDAVCVFIPFYGLWWSARIAWRLTYKLAPVAVRDWPPASARESSWPDWIVRRLRTRVA